MRNRLTYYFIFTLFTSLSVHAQDTTYRGREFWVGYGHHQFMEPSFSNNQELVLYLSTQQNAATVTVTVDSSDVPWTRTYNIPANTVITTDPIPKTGPSGDARLYSPAPPFGSGSTGFFRKKGIHIVSDVPIAAYSHIYGTASSGASLLLPVQTWGYTYTSLNSKQVYAASCFSWAYIIAKENNTEVEITPSVVTRAQNLTGLQPGIAKIITLQKGHIYQVLGANLGCDADGNGGSSTSGFELTGTKFRSLSAGKPIAVFSGSSRTNNLAACGSGGGDNDMAQLFPLHLWGKKYLTAPLSASNSASTAQTGFYKIVVHDPATVVTRNGMALAGLINNTYYIYESNTPAYIEADKPILVAQFMNGGACTAGGAGDPDMYYLSPLDAGIKNVHFVRTNKEGISVNYATLIVPTAGLASLQIDGSSIFDHSYAHPSLAGYTVVVKRWASAISQTTITCDSAFTGITYGMGSVESYGYNMGAHFRPINGIDPMVPMAWLGTISGNWFEGSNWSLGRIPEESDHVIIPPGTPHAPVISGSQPAFCSSIVASGAEITISPGARLEVRGK